MPILCAGKDGARHETATGEFKTAGGQILLATDDRRRGQIKFSFRYGRLHALVQATKEVSCKGG
jgi:hypothetical protein